MDEKPKQLDIQKGLLASGTYFVLHKQTIIRAAYNQETLNAEMFTPKSFKELNFKHYYVSHQPNNPTAYEQLWA